MDELLAELRIEYPGMPDGFLRAWAVAWEQTGDSELALSMARQDSRYDSWFPGLRRDDGTVRMSEVDYAERVFSYRNVIADAGVNPDLFESRYVQLIEGDVSAAEFARRVDTVQRRVLQNIDGVRQALVQYENTGGITDQAILAWALDPDNMGQAILEQRISMAEIGAEASRSGYFVGAVRARQLANLGVDQERARTFYRGAQGLVEELDRLAGFTTGDTDVDIREYEDAALFGDVDQMRRLSGLADIEDARFGQSGMSRTRRRVTGLVER